MSGLGVLAGFDVDIYDCLPVSGLVAIFLVAIFPARACDTQFYLVHTFDAQPVARFARATGASWPHARARG